MSNIKPSLLHYFIALLLVAVAWQFPACSKQAWPQPIVPRFLDATTKIPTGAWFETTGPTNSMGDAIPPGSRIVLRKYVLGEKLPKGTVVVYNRTDIHRVLHMIADESGSSYYMTGTNNAISDGWFDKSTVEAVLVAIVR